MSVEEDTKTSKNGNMIIEFDCPQTEEKTVETAATEKGVNGCFGGNGANG